MAEYIERQAVMNKFAEVVAPSNNSDFQKPPTRNDVVEIVENLPSADVRPVVHGRWEPWDLTYGRRYYFCSACKMTVDMPTVMGAPMFRYCPYCGADTREGREE